MRPEDVCESEKREAGGNGGRMPTETGEESPKYLICGGRQEGGLRS